MAPASSGSSTRIQVSSLLAMGNTRPPTPPATMAAQGSKKAQPEVTDTKPLSEPFRHIVTSQHLVTSTA